MQPDWEVWIDVNISPAIARWIADETGWIVKSSYSLNLYKKTDIEIYNLAKSGGKVIIISKDADFSELITMQGAPPKLINIKIGNCDNRQLWNMLKPHIAGFLKTLSTTEINIIDFE